MPQNSLTKEFTKGLLPENPVFRQLLGMCPTLAVTNSVVNGLAMGLATTFVLVSSGIVISLLRKLIPRYVRIAAFTVIIATFVTLADLFLKANFFAISKELGPYVPLIVVNCIILGRHEAFTSKNSVFRSILDTVGMGLGFIGALLVLSSIREILGNGTIFGKEILKTTSAGGFFEPWIIMLLPAGAFITLGLLIMGMNLLGKRQGG